MLEIELFLFLVHDILLEYGVFLIIALGCYVTMMSGQLSLCHGALAGLGAYATTVVSYIWGLPPLLGVFCGILGGVVGGLFITYVVSFRLVGMYLAIATFAFNEAMAVIWRNVDYVGGTLGVVGIPLIDEVLPLHIWQPIDDLWILIIVIALVSFFLWRVEKSYLGRCFRASFDDERIAEAMGVNLRMVKLLSWSIGGGIAGMGGALFAHNIGIIRPDNFQIPFAVLVLLAPVIGGYTKFWGVYLGAFVIIFGPHILNYVSEIIGAGLNVNAPETKMMLFGGLYIAFMLWRPDGIIDRRGFPWRSVNIFRLMARQHAARANP